MLHGNGDLQELQSERIKYTQKFPFDPYSDTLRKEIAVYGADLSQTNNKNVRAPIRPWVE